MAKMVTRGLSMAPLILPGDSLVIEKVSQYKTDDIVVFKKDGRYIAHRVIYQNIGRTLTKGDRNLKDDGFIQNAEILGKVTAVKRKRRKIFINHFYLTQSSSYLRELAKIAEAFSRAKIPHVFIKGLPVHLFAEVTVPKRLYVDADILIKRKKKDLASEILHRLGFNKLPEESAFEGYQPTQLTFYKETTPFPVVIDLHLDIALGFTRAPSANELLSNLEKFTNLVFKQSVTYRIGKTNFRIPDKESIVVISLIHLFHHNFKNASTLNFTREILKDPKIDFQKVAQMINSNRLKNFLFPAALILNRFYPESLPKSFIQSIKPNFPKNLFANFFALASWPFSEEKRTVARMKRFGLIFLLSPKKAGEKVKIIFGRNLRHQYLVSMKSLAGLGAHRGN